MLDFTVHNVWPVITPAKVRISEFPNWEKHPLKPKCLIPTANLMSFKEDEDSEHLSFSGPLPEGASVSLEAWEGVLSNGNNTIVIPGLSGTLVGHEQHYTLKKAMSEMTLINVDTNKGGFKKYKVRLFSGKNKWHMTVTLESIIRTIEEAEALKGAADLRQKALSPRKEMAEAVAKARKEIEQWLKAS